MENIQAAIGQLITVRLKGAGRELETCQRVNGKRTFLSFEWSPSSRAARAGDVWAVTLLKRMERNRIHYVHLHEIVEAVDGLEEEIAASDLYYVDGIREAHSLCTESERVHGPTSVEALLASIKAMDLIISSEFYLRLKTKALAAFAVCESALHCDEHVARLNEVAAWLEGNRMHDDAVRCYLTVLSAHEQAKISVSEKRVQEIRFYLGTRKACACEWTDAVEFFKLVGTRDGDIEVAKCLVQMGRLAEACQVYQNIIDQAEFVDHERLCYC